MRKARIIPPVLTEYCNVCDWKGAGIDTTLDADENGHIIVRCPKCQADITPNIAQAPKQKVNGYFVLNFIGGILAICLYLIVQSFILTCWILTAGRSESPKQFHKTCSDLMRKLPDTY